MCTLEKRNNLFILNLTGDDEHRLTLTLIDAILSALAQAKAQSTNGSVLLTVSQGKFFCNGGDLTWIRAAESTETAQRRMMYLVERIEHLCAVFLSLPMPTVAALSGHAAGSGFALALCHDYVLMRSDKGVLYMSEQDLGMTYSDFFMTLVRAKVGSSSARRDILLRGRKIRGDEAVRMAIVDGVYEGEDGVRAASERLAEELAKPKLEGEVYAENRRRLFLELCRSLGLVAKTVPLPFPKL